MTEQTQLGGATRDRFLEEVRQALLDFERKERDFLKRDREERAAALNLPLEQIRH